MARALFIVLALSHASLACRVAPPADDPLRVPAVERAPIDPERGRVLEDRLREAAVRHAADPTDEDAIVWLGRRTAYLGRYEEAIAIYTRGLQLHPQSARLLRHRGHRLLSTRRLERAIADLERAAELVAGQPDGVEQDGLPNARNIPIGTTKGNIYYHLGLAHYLAGDLEGALAAYDERAFHLDRNDDNRCATSYWRFLILKRLGREAEASALLEAISTDMDVIENFAYHELLLLYKGLKPPEDFLQVEGDEVHAAAIEGATRAYGLSMWFLFQGELERARSMWLAIVRDPRSVDAFGTLAAEAELGRW